MTQSFWRIAAETPRYAADDLTGAGAAAHGGRWNQPGIAMVYASSSRALAALETLVHVQAGGLPFNRYLVRIDVPQHLIDSASRLDAASAPIAWDAEPAGLASIAHGSEWAKSAASALLLVPSVIVPEEANLLINPRHPDAGAITATKVRRWLFDPRLG